MNASAQETSRNRLVSTDPPYYDNIGYADLSDFFYVWLRRTLRPVFPDLFATLAVPKAEELVATPYRHGGKEQAEQFFLEGMTKAMNRLAAQAHPAFPVTIYYAFKQAESNGKDGTSSTGWETFLDAVIRAGFAITGTWPMRTELSNRMIGSGTNALASSIVLVCRPRIPHPSPPPPGEEAGLLPPAVRHPSRLRYRRYSPPGEGAGLLPPAGGGREGGVTRRDFLAALKAELPQALRLLQAGNIAPVDLAQAAIGPGMAVYTRYARVLDTQGNPVSVREALALINQTLDETLAEQEGDFDADTRWALAWFEQHGFAEGEFGVAETLSKAKNTSVDGMVAAGIVEAKRGKVRLLKPEELPERAAFQVVTVKDAGKMPAHPAYSAYPAYPAYPAYSAHPEHLTVWECVHRLIHTLNTTGEVGAAALVTKLGSQADTARELAYRLYTICERKKRANEALAYNALVQSWPEITRLAQEQRGRSPVQQAALFGGDEA